MATALEDLGRRAKRASRDLALASSATKDAALARAAELLVDAGDLVLEANAADLGRAGSGGVPGAVLDRLRLDRGRLEAMAGGLRQVAGLPDPVGEVVGGWTRPNGLEIRQVRVPLGVVAVIYENRPNVTSDAAGLCVKAGNAAFLRGSSAAINSNQAIAGILREGFAGAGLPEDSVILVPDTSRESVVELLRLESSIDCLIPRGGRGLIDQIRAHATVPYVIDGDGNCHVYVDAGADLEMATAIVVNGKTQRPGVCNATESVVVHGDVAGRFLPALAAALAGVELVGDEAACAIVGAGRMAPATEADHGTEYLDLKLSVKVVGSLDEGIAHVNRFGSGHSEAIVTNDLHAARRFVREVDAAAVLVNASTRFTDGEQFGFGAEIGISTQKLHARGPMGLRELTTTKYVVDGSGHIRL
ncbi:MAG: glutamate-5-semialdehyde dehydrogenase [Acidimicrobiales bacterium]